MWILWCSVLKQLLELLLEFFRNVLKENLQAPAVITNVWQRLGTPGTYLPFLTKQELQHYTTRPTQRTKPPLRTGRGREPALTPAQARQPRPVGRVRKEASFIGARRPPTNGGRRWRGRRGACSRCARSAERRRRFESGGREGLAAAGPGPGMSSSSSRRHRLAEDLVRQRERSGGRRGVSE